MDEGDDTPPKSVIEGQLQQIRSEAEAAWTCCASPRAEEAPPSPRAEEVERPTDPGGPVSAPADVPAEAPAEPPSSGSVRNYGVAIFIIVVVLAAAYYFYRR
jgi:hypothetical protein